MKYKCVECGGTMKFVDDDVLECQNCGHSCELEYWYEEQDEYRYADMYGTSLAEDKFSSADDDYEDIY